MVHKRKLRVAVLYGGRSGEHEVSLRSAASVIHHLDRNRFEIIPVGIDKDGKWLLNDVSLIEKSAESLPLLRNLPEVVLSPPSRTAEISLIQMDSMQKKVPIDVVFPVMHGPLCEDGSIQGLLELSDIPYVGCGVLASAVAMDKDVAKRLVRASGLPIVPFLAVKKEEWQKQSKEITKKIQKTIGYPLFVKPANLGSSVGVHKVKKAEDLKLAMEDAFSYDMKLLVEKAIQARELEFAVLENPQEGESPLVAAPGEIVPNHEFYSYDAKYMDENGARLIIPAPLAPNEVVAAQKIAVEAYQALQCESMVRVDLFMDKQSGELYFNEANTIPGFTSISMYPKMWEFSGVSYSELLSRLIDLALNRHEKRKKLKRDYI